jgi:hypothetical protein
MRKVREIYSSQIDHQRGRPSVFTVEAVEFDFLDIRILDQWPGVCYDGVMDRVKSLAIPELDSL